ncbi:MAG: hypothetical protein RLZZ488_1691 [Pseudomonadota bacterium]|jgi:hypothetical protein
MKRSMMFVLSALSFLSFVDSAQAAAIRGDSIGSQRRHVANLRKPVRLVQNGEENVETPEVQQPRVSPAKKEEFPWYFRVQQAPWLALSTVSDTGVVDLEFMKAVNEYFWVGPTVVWHAQKSNDTRMRSLNGGLRIDFVLPSFGSIDLRPHSNTEVRFYVSNAFLFGHYTSKTFTEVTRAGVGGESTTVVTCDFKSEGLHQGAALVVGAQFHFNEKFHSTAGLGVVKTKIRSSQQSGFCDDKSIVRSEGRELPWLDLGIGYKL